jgi:SAM-dependent methyltransferase
MRRVPAAVYAMLYAGGWLFSAAATVIFHAAAGLFRVDDLQRASRRTWDEVAAGQSESYISSGFLAWEREFYLPLLKPDDRILLVGCGSGRDLLALWAHGYRTDGLDSGSQLTAVAREMVARHRWPATILTGAIETVTLTTRYDVVIFSWFCYSYIPQARSRVEVLRKVKAHLDSGGRVLISYILPAPGRRRTLISLTRLMARLSGSDWHPEPGDYLSHDRPGRYISHYEHQFRPEEIEAEARTAGLAVALHEQKDHGFLVLKM